MEKDMMFKAKDYLSDQCYGSVYTKYFPESDDLFVKFNFDGIDVKIIVNEFLSNIVAGQSVAEQMDDVLQKARFVLCNILSSRYFK